MFLLLGVVIVCFGIELFLRCRPTACPLLLLSHCLALCSEPDLMGVLGGLVPQVPPGALFAAVGMLGATVMPHNLYLHSSVVRRPAADTGVAASRSFLWSFIDTAVALNAAAFVNASIIIGAAVLVASRCPAPLTVRGAVSAATFWKRHVVVAEIQAAHELLRNLLGPAAGVVFGLGLVCSGQSSAISGTLAGQVVMEVRVHRLYIYMCVCGGKTGGPTR
jgi:manganese transport protein